MDSEAMEYVYHEKDGTATYKGELYYLVDSRAMRIPGSRSRVINAVHAKAQQLDPGYFPMTLLFLPEKWVKGGEAEAAVANGEFDWIMREQKGIFTAPRGYNGRRCHDC